ncbi:MAG: DUF2914 domain-containing protein [Desulfobacteraceae bacterium]|nr:DUF2914 domain-containing protein [Desulfobacteraceae bacterium]MBC2755738.1 DUF2914 domain-containing protein [Desulfobacteraceae bacterium]
MFFKIVSILICVLCLPLSLPAQEVSPVTVNEMVFCRGIERRNPVDTATHFPDSVERVFCYTKLSSTEDHADISHVWYYNDTQMAIVDLGVNARSWRTWSSKSIVKEWTGTWRVDVISSTGNIICSDEFVVSSNSE